MGHVWTEETIFLRVIKEKHVTTTLDGIEMQTNRIFSTFFSLNQGLAGLRLYKNYSSCISHHSVQTPASIVFILWKTMIEMQLLTKTTFHLIRLKGSRQSANNLFKNNWSVNYERLPFTSLPQGQNVEKKHNYKEYFPAHAGVKPTPGDACVRSATSCDAACFTRRRTFTLHSFSSRGPSRGDWWSASMRQELVSHKRWNVSAIPVKSKCQWIPHALWTGLII